MNQIYNLSQTISEDKEIVAALENRLLNAKNILAAHEQAMERLTTIPNVIVSDNKETLTTVCSTASESVPVKRERITLENYWDLGIEIGDQVEIVVSGDMDFTCGSTHEISDILTKDYIIDGHREECILQLQRCRGNCWYDYDVDNTHELYLIRTPEGSLNKQ